MGIGRRIQAAMIAAGKRPVDIANHLKIKDAAVSQWFSKDSGPRTDRLPALASFLATSVDALVSDAENAHLKSPRSEVRHPEPPITLPQRDHMPLDVPVYGTAMGGTAGGDFTLNGDIGMRVRRPPRLAERDDIFALFVQGDSMLPRFRPGELIYLERQRPPQNGDYVVVEMRPGQDGEHAAYLKQLVATTPTKVRLLQYNPKRTIEIERRKILQILRVMPLNDLLGV